jgi:[ribosomal protein S5]-alanine N-acetyltransferase
VKNYLPDWNVPKSIREVWLNKYEIPENIDFLSEIAKEGRIRNLRIRLAMILKESHDLIGFCCSGIKEELNPPNREIMFAISQEHQNKGYTTQAVQGLVKYLFQNSDVEEIVAIALIDNKSSNKVIQKSGFELISNINIEDKEYNYYIINKAQVFRRGH